MAGEEPAAGHGSPPHLQTGGCRTAPPATGSGGATGIESAGRLTTKGKNSMAAGEARAAKQRPHRPSIPRRIVCAPGAMILLFYRRPGSSWRFRIMVFHALLL